MSWTGERVRLFVGDDWAEDHHDVELMDAAGRVLAKRRLPEGVAGMARLHELIGQQLGEDADDAEVVIGIETDRGPWVAALVAAGYTVLRGEPAAGVAVPGTARRVRRQERRGDAHMLADMVRTDSHQLRAVAGDSADAEGIKVLARTHKTLIWERTRQVQRLRHQLREYFPAALEAFDDLDAPDTLELLGKAPDPARAREADPRAGQRGAQARPPPEHPGQGDRDPGGAAQRAAGPAACRHRRLRRHRPVPDRGDHRPERAGQDPARAGGGAFWPAPGR